MFRMWSSFESFNVMGNQKHPWAFNKTSMSKKCFWSSRVLYAFLVSHLGAKKISALLSNEFSSQFFFHFLEKSKIIHSTCIDLNNLLNLKNAIYMLDLNWFTSHILVKYDKLQLLRRNTSPKWQKTKTETSLSTREAHIKQNNGVLQWVWASGRARGLPTTTIPAPGPALVTTGSTPGREERVASTGADL